MALPTSANTAALYVSGTSTVDTNEACSHLSGSGGNQIFQVTATTKRVWDPTVPITIKDNGTTVPTTDYTFDYLSGLITFSGYTPTTPVTATGNYYPIWQLGFATKYSVGFKRAVVDATNFDSVGAVERFATLADVEGTINLNEIGNTVLDGVSMTLESILSGGAMIVGVFGTGAGNNFIRAFIQLESLKTDGDVKDIYRSTVGWKLSNQVQTAAAWSINP